MKSDEDQGKKSWVALEGLRGILALSVLGIHTLDNDSNIRKAISCVISPVNVFIILSGFSCGRGYANKDWNKQNIKAFYKRRFVRILPMYILSSSILLVLRHITNVSKYTSVVHIVEDLFMQLNDYIRILENLNRVADIFPFQNDVITHHLDDPNCVIKFFERLSLTFLWDIYYPRNCQKNMSGPGEWFLAIVIYGYIVFPLFSEMMKRHLKPLRIFVVVVILFVDRLSVIE